MNRTSRLLSAGIYVAPVFVGLSVILALASPGFSLARHEVSLLLAGSLGWAQTINFIATGLLGLAFAVGLRQSLRGEKAGTWGPILLGVYGLCFLAAGFFHPDPHLGYPAGAPADMPTVPSAAAGLHSLAFSLLALAIVSAGFVFARRFKSKGERGWATYSIVNSVAIIALIATGSALLANGNGGIFLLGVAVAISSWISLVALHLLKRF